MEDLTGFRRAALTVALLNLGFFALEMVVALSIRSVSLLADSVDFLEDGAVNLLIFFATAWTLLTRSRVGRLLALVTFIPAIATVWIAIIKMLDPERPNPLVMGLTAGAALLVNLVAAALLVRHRHLSASIARAAWLSARNDAIANLAIIGVALVSVWLVTGWFDIVVGLGIAVLNASAARTVWRAARAERLDARSLEA